MFKLDTDGALLWTWDYPTDGTSTHFGRGVAVDETNDEVVVLVAHDYGGDADLWIGRLTE